MSSLRLLALSCLGMGSLGLTTAAEDPPPPGVRILDGDALLCPHSYPRPVISPDGRRVAYASRGGVWVASTDGSGAARLQVVAPLTEELSPEAYEKFVRKAAKRVEGFCWTPDSQALAWSVKTHDQERNATAIDFWIAKPGEEPRRLPPHDHGAASRWGVRAWAAYDFDVSRNLRWLVHRGHERPLIRSVETGEPVATPFLFLTPSPTSDRWIGVEKDTRQLVITDAEFNVTERFNVRRDQRSWGFELLWSPNERFVLWRNQIGFDHYSNWEGFLMDLKTGKRRALKGQFMREQFEFTGRGGELLRAGAQGKRNPRISGTITTGAWLVLYPGCEDEPDVLWEHRVDPEEGRQSIGLPLLGIQSCAAPDGSLFAAPLPRTDEFGWDWRLIDRNKKTYPLRRMGTDAYVSACSIAGFADDGKSLIGYTSRSVIAIPVDAILERDGAIEGP